MIGLHAVQARKTTLLQVHNVGAGNLVFRYHKIIDRIAKRFGKDIAMKWTQALIKYRGHIDEQALISAISSGNLHRVEAVVNAHALQLTVEKALRDPLLQAIRAAGVASTQFLAAHGIEISFNAVHPNVVLFAQQHAGALVTSIPEDVRETIRLITALGASGRATVQQQARMLKQVVGLPRNWALAPLHFGDELRDAMRTGSQDLGMLNRRLSATDVSRVTSRIQNGTLDESFINDMEVLYSERLIALRAETIARTESIRAANFGVQDSWRQGVADGLLDQEVRQFWIVTPDDRLCPICVEIPGMNPDGVGLNDLFDTPEGPVDAPPAPHPNCRCALGLVLPGQDVPEEDQA